MGWWTQKGNEKKHILSEENSILVQVKEEVDHVKPMKDIPKGYTPTANMRHALDLFKSKLKRYTTTCYQNNVSSKQNSNVGDTVEQ